MYFGDYRHFDIFSNYTLLHNVFEMFQWGIFRKCHLLKASLSSSGGSV